MSRLGYTQAQAESSMVLALVQALDDYEDQQVRNHEMMCFAGGRKSPYTKRKVAHRKRDWGATFDRMADTHNAQWSAQNSA